MTINIPKNLQQDYPELNNLTVNIPKIIHQTYKSLEQLPKVWKETPNSWKYKNPEWEYKFWSDEDNRNLVKTNFPWFLSTYDSYQYPIQRADAIRYMILYTYGGMYSDMDIFCRKSIDDLYYKDFDVYLLKTPNTDIVTNCLMASKKGSKFWIMVLENMIKLQKEPSILWLTKHLTVMNTTGPSMLENMYQLYDKKDTIKFLPTEFLFPRTCNVCSEKPCTDEGCYTVILNGSSWCSLDSTIFSFIYCNYHYLLPIILISIIIYIVCVYTV